VRQGLLHYLEFLDHELGDLPRQPRDVASRPRKAGHVAETDRVGMSGEHYGDRLGRPSGGLHLGRRSREDDVDFQADQVGCGFGQPFGRFSRSKRNGNVLSLNIPEVPQAYPQCFYPVRRNGGYGTQIPDLVDLRRLLGLARERCKCEAESENDREPDQPHAAGESSRTLL